MSSDTEVVDEVETKVEVNEESTQLEFQDKTNKGMLMLARLDLVIIKRIKDLQFVAYILLTIALVGFAFFIKYYVLPNDPNILKKIIKVMPYVAVTIIWFLSDKCHAKNNVKSLGKEVEQKEKDEKTITLSKTDLKNLIKELKDL